MKTLRVCTVLGAFLILAAVGMKYDTVEVSDTVQAGLVLAGVVLVIVGVIALLLTRKVKDPWFPITRLSVLCAFNWTLWYFTDDLFTIGVILHIATAALLVVWMVLIVISLASIKDASS